MEFAVTGAPLVLRDRRPPTFTTRRIYNAAFFSEERRVEIANNYRPHALQPRLRRRRRQIVVPCRNSAYGQDVDDRATLPVAVHSFPRFAQVYTPRGRRTLCERAPPDRTFNDTVRRIRAANSCDELAALVRRQLGCASASAERERRRRPRRCRRPISVSVDEHTSLQRHTRRPPPSPPPPPPPPVLTEHSASTTRSNRQPPPVVLQRRGSHYQQLAVDYYEQGFLGRIRYLQSIGARNSHQTASLSRFSIKVPRPAAAAAQAPAPASSASPASPTTTGEEAAEPSSRAESAATDRFDDDSGARLSANRIGRSLSALLRRIGRERSFRTRSTVIGSAAAAAAGAPAAAAKGHVVVCEDWAIRVKIKPAGGVGGVGAFRASACSMNDYLNANAEYSSNTGHHRGTGGRSAKAGADQRYFCELIDNLSELEISDDSGASLPKITLTDYCCCTAEQTTTAAAAAAAAAAVSGEHDQPQRTQRAPLSLKQSRFGLDVSLDIPNEAFYSGEARPP